MIDNQSKGMKPFNLNDLQKRIDRAEKTAAQNSQRSFRRTVQDWENKPDFRVEPTGDEEGTYRVMVEGEMALVWNYLDQGRDTPYRIPKDPDPSHPLVFPSSPYMAKTSPNRIESRPAPARAERPVTIVESVTHPGYAARNWRKMIAKRDGERRAKAVKKAIEDFFKD